MRPIFLVVVIFSNFHRELLAQNPVITLSNGRIQGYRNTQFSDFGRIDEYLVVENISTETVSKYSNKIFAELDVFHGIPFAEKPIRFEKPEIINTAFNGIRDCKEHKMACSQANEDFSAEDCLHLSVYKPVQVDPGTNIPVVVYIHGGEFVFGSAKKYDGSLLASIQNKIVVVIQYRLGLFGFFKANLGLWDQRVALEWVQREIANFGGDKDNVHLIGENAGAVSVVAQLHHDAFKSNWKGENKLFQKATILSGCTLHDCIFVNSVFEAALAKRQLHGDNSTDNSYNPEQYFNNLSEKQLLHLQTQVELDSNDLNWSFLKRPNAAISRPVIDNEFIFGKKEQYDYINSKNIIFNDLTEDSLGTDALTDLDFTGYELIYGTVNGDGDSRDKYVGQLVRDGLISFDDVLRNDAAEFALNTVLEREERDCYEQNVNIEVLVKACLDKRVSEFSEHFYKDLSFESLVNYISMREKIYPEYFVESFINKAKSLLEFSYQSYNDGLWYNSGYVISELVCCAHVFCVLRFLCSALKMFVVQYICSHGILNKIAWF